MVFRRKYWDRGNTRIKKDKNRIAENIRKQFNKVRQGKEMEENDCLNNGKC